MTPAGRCERKEHSRGGWLSLRFDGHAAFFLAPERYGGAAKVRVLLSIGRHLDAIEEALNQGSPTGVSEPFFFIVLVQGCSSAKPVCQKVSAAT